MRFFLLLGGSFLVAISFHPNVWAALAVFLMFWLGYWFGGEVGK